MTTVATLSCIPVLCAIGYWMVIRRNIEKGEPEVVVLDQSTFARSAVRSGALGNVNVR